MKKVAIVGVEGSGKTVMLAGLGELYSHPDERGYFMTPKNFTTASYVADKIARMRNGEWPVATAEDVLQGLDWTIRQKNPSGGRPIDVCEISCLDFAGEVYRSAFGIKAESGEASTEEVEALKDYVRKADDIIVLINLRDIIVKGIADPRVRESIWITKAILQFALDKTERRVEPRASIVLTQADSYADTIKACGGAKGVLSEYLRDVANNYDWLEVSAVSVVDKTRLDDDGNVVPAPDFQSTELRMVMDWIVFDLSAQGNARQKPVEKHSRQKIVAHDDTAKPKISESYFRSLRRIFDYAGRSSRREYWCFILGQILTILGLVVVMGVAAAIAEGSSSDADAILSLLALVGGAGVFLPALSLNVRRLHDVGITGWAILGLLIPYVGWVAALVIAFVKGNEGANKYGDPPEW